MLGFVQRKDRGVQRFMSVQSVKDSYVKKRHATGHENMSHVDMSRRFHMLPVVLDRPVT